ncbi:MULTISPECIES: type 1 glutamine amidotransferase family protein [unclassified Carboxylicivirga]|uniref:type 1 glutamine amidotransferase family protein n=1 Tax=Carboxylicivirga TaxID=1628153 RepID=UPI003D34F30C
MKKKVYVFLFDGFSDWEISYLTPEINKDERFDLIYFSADGKAITSMGGMTVQPSASLTELNSNEINLLVLPGGTAWEQRAITSTDQLVKDLFEKGKTIAAICGATVYLGQLGILDKLNHTSIDLNYLKAVAPEYQGSNSYQNKLAETDKNLITANGIAPIEFAREVFRTLGLKNDSDLEKWFQLFKNGVWSE